MIELNEENIKEIIAQLSEKQGLLKNVPTNLLDKADFMIEAELWDRYTED